MKRVFVDTSAWYAFINAADPDHRRVAEALPAVGTRLVTSNYVFDELVTLCRYRLGHGPAAKAGRFLLEAAWTDMVRVSAADEREAWSLFLARKDKSYSFTDCTSFVLMRRLRLQQAVALDEDFMREGFEVSP